MLGLQLTYAEFATEVRISSKPYILLEGRQDKRFFEILSEAMGEAKGLPDASRSQTVIQTAEYIRSATPGEGNREKVEKVSALICTTPFQSRFVGFVDREFREFRFDNAIGDSLCAQRQLHRLVWSRGHSVENYLLDFDVFRKPLSDVSLNGRIAQRALECLRENFPMIINTACALGLAAHQLDQLKTVRQTVHWKSMELSKSAALWNTACWKVALENRSDLSLGTIESLVREFEHWFDVAQSSSPAEVRWACDGHIGLRFVWHAYAKAVYEISQTEGSIGPNPANQRDKVIGIDDPIKLNLLARHWAQNLGVDFTDTPGICFGMVGVSH